MNYFSTKRLSSYAFRFIFLLIISLSTIGANAQVIIVIEDIWPINGDSKTNDLLILQSATSLKFKKVNNIPVSPIESEGGVSISPNPASSQLTITSNDGEVINLKITNTGGSVILNQANPENQLSVNLPNGYYWFEVRVGSNISTHSVQITQQQ